MCYVTLLQLPSVAVLLVTSQIFLAYSRLHRVQSRHLYCLTDGILFGTMGLRNWDIRSREQE
jgi:hypothetical protein